MTAIHHLETIRWLIRLAESIPYIDMNERRNLGKENGGLHGRLWVYAARPR